MIKAIIEKSILSGLSFGYSIKQPNFYQVWLFYRLLYVLLINGNLMPVVLNLGRS